MKYKQKSLWITVTHDEYEFPVIISDSIEELAEACGTTENNIYSSMSHAKKRGAWCRFVRVPLE